eukprot:SAG11_NODE_4007_length_2109_cov_1.591045_1_plen_298_part_00
MLTLILSRPVFSSRLCVWYARPTDVAQTRSCTWLTWKTFIMHIKEWHIEFVSFECLRRIDRLTWQQPMRRGRPWQQQMLGPNLLHGSVGLNSAAQILVNLNRFRIFPLLSEMANRRPLDVGQLAPNLIWRGLLVSDVPCLNWPGVNNYWKYLWCWPPRHVELACLAACSTSRILGRRPLRRASLWWISPARWQPFALCTWTAHCMHLCTQATNLHSSLCHLIWKDLLSPSYAQFHRSSRALQIHVGQTELCPENHTEVAWADRVFAGWRPARWCASAVWQSALYFRWPGRVGRRSLG